MFIFNTQQMYEIFSMNMEKLVYKCKKEMSKGNINRTYKYILIFSCKFDTKRIKIGLRLT